VAARDAQDGRGLAAKSEATGPSLMHFFYVFLAKPLYIHIYVCVCVVYVCITRELGLTRDMYIYIYIFIHIIQ